MSTKAYLLSVLVIDHDGIGIDSIKEVLHDQKFPNWCMSPTVISHKEADLGQWHDDHPLNQPGQEKRLKDYFPDPPSIVIAENINTVNM